MPVKKILFGHDAREALATGVRTLNECVKTTLGPRGRNVLIGLYDGAIGEVTKDGVTVAKQVELADPMQDQGVRLVRQVAMSTDEKVGDGTTTATLLTATMLEEAFAYVEDNVGVNITELQRGMEAAKEIAVSELQTMRKSITEKGRLNMLRQVATVSANNDIVLGGLIADAFETVGEYGMVQAQLSKVDRTFLETRMGYSFDKGYMHAYFAEPGDVKAVLKDPLIMLTDATIRNARQVLPAMELAVKRKRPLIIIAAKFVPPAFGLLLQNRLNGLPICCVEAPSAGHWKEDILKDIAAYTGATYFSEKMDMNIEGIEFDDFGEAETVNVDQWSTVIYGGKGDEEEIADRVDQVKQEIEADDKIRYGERGLQIRQKRLARLTSGIALLMIGSKSETQSTERMYRATDAIFAVKAAIEEGVVPGGGVSYLRCTNAVEGAFELKEPGPYRTGMEIVFNALASPTATILHNAGLLDKYRDQLDMLRTDKKIRIVDAYNDILVDPYKAGIVDPYKVAQHTISASVSVAVTVLGTECLIVPDKIKNDRPYEDHTGFNSGKKVMV